MVGLNEAVKTGSGPIVTFRPISPKTQQRKGLRSSTRLDEPYLMMARYYSSSLGRFLAVDPGNSAAPENPQSWNKYAYVRNNPIGRIDPDGKCPSDPNPPAPAPTLGDRIIGAAKSMVADVVGAGNTLMLHQNASGERPSMMEALGAVATILVATMVGPEGEAGAGVRAAETASEAAPASSAMSGLNLQKSLATEAQATESGTVMAGAGSTKVFRGAGQAAETYGGEAADYAKTTSSSFTAKDGTKIQTHSVVNKKTDAVVEQKVKETH